MTGFRQRYGPWALVAGASQGIGAAFATALARRGVDLVLVARRPGPLAAPADRLPVRTATVQADLGLTTGLAAVDEATHGLEIGLVVVNAAYSPIGRLVDQDPELTRRALDLNCRVPLALAHRHLPAMAARGRGGLGDHVVARRDAGHPVARHPRRDQGVRCRARRGPLSRAARQRRGRPGLCRRAVATPGLSATMRRPAPGTVTRIGSPRRPCARSAAARGPCPAT